MTFKYHSRSSKVALIESQCVISYQQSILTFAVSRTVLEKFYVKQFDDIEICPRSLTVISSESCRVAMYVKCSEDSERKKRKQPFLTTTLSFDAHSPGNPREYLHKPYSLLPATTFHGLHVCCWQYMGSSANFRTVLSESRRCQPKPLPSPKQILMQNGHSR